ncbi:MAG: hypothetical protein V4582_09950 [Pseudomonadota bacterium]
MSTKKPTPAVETLVMSKPKRQARVTKLTVTKASGKFLSAAKPRSSAKIEDVTKLEDALTPRPIGDIVRDMEARAKKRFI